MSLLTGLPSAICCFFTGINIPIEIDICKSFMIYFQIFTTFGYKSLKNSNIKEKSFSEGNDVIGLIEDVDISGNQTQQIFGDWSSDDDILLRTLVEDRQCSLDIVASVFKRSVESIQKRCVDLSISYEVNNG